jgi:hypothetical protein
VARKLADHIVRHSIRQQQIGVIGLNAVKYLNARVYRFPKNAVLPLVASHDVNPESECWGLTLASGENAASNRY